MLENQIWTVVCAVLLAGFATSVQPDTAVEQDYQPTTQGIPSGPTIVLNIILTHPYGHVKRTETWDADALDFVHTETQFYETHIQASGIFKQDAADTVGLTASDLANLAYRILSSDASLALLRAGGLGLLRVTTVRNAKFTDGEQQFEMHPSFDFVLTHEQVTVTRTPAATSQELRTTAV